MCKVYHSYIPHISTCIYNQANHISKQSDQHAIEILKSDYGTKPDLVQPWLDQFDPLVALFNYQFYGYVVS